VTPFSSELLKRHCDKEMKEGVVMMGQELTITNEYDIKVYRNEVELTNGSFVHSNERLLVVIEPVTIKQLVLEVNSNGNSYFENGKCSKSNRINSNKATLIISDDQSIIINGVIAKSYSSGVKLIKGGGFHLIQANDNEEL
jgi:hypothetical protein